MGKEQIIIDKKECPICTRSVLSARGMTEKQGTVGLWYMCSCGVMFNNEVPKNEPKDKEEFKQYDDFKEYELVSVQAARMYAPIIEELTMGRKFFDVGFGRYNNINFFKKRGWVTFGIDHNKDIESTDRIYNDNFETTDKLYSSTYDVVWMSHIFEKFKDPLFALGKAKQILQSNGVLYIATPDIDFLHSKPASDWTHWNTEDNNVMWNERSLKRELEKMGFNIIMCRRNYYSRFGFYNDIHLIAQKIYF